MYIVYIGHTPKQEVVWLTPAMIVLSDIIQEALDMKTNEHAEVLKEVASLKEALEQKAVSNEKS